MDNKLGELISELRKKKNLTQKELANLLYVSNKAVSRWECGHSLPDVDKLLLISQIFEVNLNDLITLRTASAKDNEELVKEMIQEFSEANKKNAKKIRIILLFALFVVLFLTISIIFINSYNRFKVYRVYMSSEDFYPITGTYIETRIRDSLFLGNINLKDVKINVDDTVSVNLYIIEDKKEIILYNFSSLDNINFISSQSYYKIDDLSDYIDKIYLKVTILNSKNEVLEYDTKIKLVRDFSNNEIYLNKYSSDEDLNYDVDVINSKDISKILIENDFEELTGRKLIKKSENYTITYFKDLNKITYSFEKNNLKYKYNYLLNSNILEIEIFDETSTEISNLKYNTANKKVIECTVGKCNDYKYAMEVLEENILNLLPNE